MKKSGEHVVILQLYARAHAPNRDYYGLTITESEAILNIWNITHGPHVFPKRLRCSLEDFQLAKNLQSDIHRLFGKHILQFCMSLSRGDHRLECLPSKILLKILRYLATNDILNLGQTSKIFSNLMNRNDIWRIVFTKRNKGKPTRDELKAAESKSWRIVLKNKLLWNDRMKRINKQKPTVPTKNQKTKDKESGSKSSSTVTKLALKEKKPNVVQDPPSYKRLQIGDGVPEVEKYQLNKFVHDPKGTPTILINNTTSLHKVVETPSIASLPIKGILKKPSNELISNKLTKHDSINEAPKPTEEKHVLTKINYEAAPKIKPPLVSQPKRKTITHAQIQRLLDDADKCLKESPFKCEDRLRTTKVSSNSRLFRSSSAKCKTDDKARNLPMKSITGAFGDSTDLSDANSELQMCSKFETYLRSINAPPIKSTSNLIKAPLRNASASGSLLSKTNLVPKIKELGKNMNEIRSSFYNTSASKVGMNNNKVKNSVLDNKIVSKQPNNKLNNATRTGSTIDVKKDMIKNKLTSSKTTQPTTSKVKNTNMIRTPSETTHKPKVKTELTGRMKSAGIASGAIAKRKGVY